MSLLKNTINQEKSKYSTSLSSKRRSRDRRPYPKNAEPAIVHPLNTSIVKVRDSGTIDMFVGSDNGIRIDPNSRTINKIGNHERSMVGAVTRSVGRNHTTEVGGNWSVKASGGSAIIDAGSSVSIKTNNADIKATNFTVASSLFNTEKINDAKIDELTEDIEKLDENLLKLANKTADGFKDVNGAIDSLKDEIVKIHSEISNIKERLTALESTSTV